MQKIIKRVLLLTIFSLGVLLSFGDKAIAANTLINVSGWNAYVHLPDDYNSTGSQKYPTIVFIPGLGEVGTDATKLKVHGPSAYIEQGWNGNVTVDGATHKFIVISLQPTGSYPRPTDIKPKIDSLKSTYRIDPNRLHLTGLSMGGWAINQVATYKPTTSDFSYVDYVTSLVNIQGVKPDDTYAATPPYPTKFIDYALRGGKAAGFEQINDGRDIATITNTMNTAVSGSSTFVQTNFGNGGHCCYSNYYGGSGLTPGNFSLSGITQNIYQWMARQVRGGTTTTPPPSNTSPTANAGSDQTITLPTSSVALSGSGSDSDGSIVTYSWAKTSGPSVPVPTGQNPTVNGLVEGTYIFTLTVTDDDGATDTDSMTVTVNPATTTNPPSTGSGRTFLIDFGSQSSATTTSGWNNIYDPRIGTSVALKDSNNTNTSSTLQITDAFVTKTTSPTSSANINGTTSSGLYPANATSDSLYITPNAPGGSVSDTSAGFVVTGLNNSATYKFTFYASRLAGDTTNRTAKYTIGSQSVNLNATDNVSTTVSIANITPTNGQISTSVALVGTYGYLGVVKIEESTSSTTPSNTAPSANAGSDKSITLPVNSVTLSGSGTDSDGSIVSYQWVKVSGSGTISSSTSATTSISNLTEGTSVYRLTVTDNAGATDTDDVSIVVNPATVIANVPPTANAGTDQSIYLPTTSTILSGSGSDSDGSIASYSWLTYLAPSGTQIVFSPASSVNPTITGLTQAGTYTFKLTVTDNSGATATDTVNVVVNPAQTGACKTVTLAPTAINEIYKPDLSSMNILPCDTIAIPAGDYSNGIVLGKFYGTAANPITIINLNGQVKAKTFKIYNAEHFKMTGSGSASHQYGFYVYGGAYSGEAIGVGVAFATRTNNYEVERLESTGTDVGLYLKMTPELSKPETLYPNYLIENVKVHDNYIHDIGGEGMYIGHTYPNGDPYNGGAVPVRMDNVKIYNNTVTNTGWDGIQLSNARTNAEIYGNTVTNFGTARIGAQQAGIILGGNTTGKVYNNTIQTGSGSGIQVFGYGDVEVKNNVIKDTGINSPDQDAIYSTPGTITIETNNPGLRLYISDNTIKNFSRIAIRAGNNNGTALPGSITNNLICGTTTYSLSTLINAPTGTTITGNQLNTTACGTTTTTPPATTNAAPVAKAGQDQSVGIGAANPRYLLGSATDSDGTIVSYVWSKTSGPGVQTMIAESYFGSLGAKVDGLQEGTYNFRLTVTDDDGASGNDDLVVTVNPNQAPVVNAGADITLIKPQYVASLNGSAVDHDGNGVITYNWTKVSGSGTISYPTDPKTAFVRINTGTTVLRLTATDNMGATSSDTVSVNVLRSATGVKVYGPTVAGASTLAQAQPDYENNKMPVVTIYSVGDVLLPKNSIQLTGTATDTDGSIVNMEWYQVAGPNKPTMDAVNRNVLNLSGLVQGKYTYAFSATDNLGDVNTAEVTFTVKPSTRNEMVTTVSNTAQQTNTVKPFDVGTRAMVSATTLNVRSAESTASAIVAKLSKGDVIEITAKGVSADWLKIRSGVGIAGYVHKNYLSVVSGANPYTAIGNTGGSTATCPSGAKFDPLTGSPCSTTSVGVGGSVYVKATRLNMRSSATATSPIVRILDRGVSLEVLSTVGLWLQVRTGDGAIGYVHKDYVSATSVISTGTTSPVYVPPTTSATPSISTGSRRVRINSEKLNIRLTPSVNAVVVGQLNSGDIADVVAVPPLSEWIQIKTASGVGGYINKNYVSIVN